MGRRLTQDHPSLKKLRAIITTNPSTYNTPVVPAAQVLPRSEKKA